MLESIIKLAVIANLKNQKRYSQVRWYMNPSFFLSEFCSVHINIGRGTGKTQCIIEMAQEGDVVLVRDSFMKQGMIAKGIKSKHVFCSVKEMEIQVAGLNVEFVYIDEAYLIENVEKIYHIFGNHTPTFIFLGR